MAVATMRMVTRLSLHIDNEDLIYDADETADLDDAVLNLVARDLAVVVV